MTRQSYGRQSGSKQTSAPPAPGHLGSAVSHLMTLKGLARRRGDAQLEHIWAEIAGERVAARTTVIGLQRGVLQVAVSGSAMLAELTAFHKSRLRDELRTREPRLKLRDIRFRLRARAAQSHGPEGTAG